MTISGFTDYGSNATNEAIVSMGSRASNSAKIKWLIKSNNDFRIGYVDDGTNMQVWLYCGGLVSDGIIEVNEATTITFLDTMETSSATPAGFVDATEV